MMNDEGLVTHFSVLGWGRKWQNQTSIQFLCGEGVKECCQCSRGRG